MGNFDVVKFWQNSQRRTIIFIDELNIWRIIWISYWACTLEKILIWWLILKSPNCQLKTTAKISRYMVRTHVHVCDIEVHTTLCIHTIPVMYVVYLYRSKYWSFCLYVYSMEGVSRTRMKPLCFAKPFRIQPATSCLSGFSPLRNLRVLTHCKMCISGSKCKDTRFAILSDIMCSCMLATKCYIHVHCTVEYCQSARPPYFNIDFLAGWWINSIWTLTVLNEPHEMTTV